MRPVKPATVISEMSEADWQKQLLELAHMLRWEHLHVRRSIGKGGKWVTATNIAWPDLTLWSKDQGRIMFVELKSEIGKATPEQESVLASLAAAGQEVHVWRPSDLDAAHEALRRPR